MEIQCEHATIDPSDTQDSRLTVTCDEARLDLILEQITHEKGISFVLDSFGKQALAEYMRQQGFHVTEQAEAA
jgi:hypothetical protein